MSWKSRYGKKNAKHAVKPNLTPPTKMPLPKNAQLVPSPPGQQMSAILWEFIDPYRNSAMEAGDNLNKLLSIAMIAWNATIARIGEGEKLIDSCLATMSAEVRQACRAMIEGMMERKRLLYSDNERMIISYELRMRLAGPHLVVMSTLPAGMERPGM